MESGQEKLCYEAVIFDFDMTLADTGHVIVGLLNETAAYFGYPTMAYEKALPCVGQTHEKMLEHVTGVAEPYELWKLREHYRMLCRQEMPKRTEFFPGVEACLQAWRDHGCKIGLLSQKLRDLLYASLDRFELTGYFDLIYGNEDVAVHKPSPDGLLDMIRRLQVPREKVLYVGDSLVDQATAKVAGVDFCAMLSGGTSQGRFAEDTVRYYCRDLGELQALLDSSIQDDVKIIDTRRK